jgi:hypothetical protein
MDASWRQFLGSLASAVLLLHWQIGLDRLTWDPNDAMVILVILGICWLITWRAWPAVEITWDFFTSPEAKRAYRPTWPQVLGALGLGLVLAVATAIPLLLAGRESDVDFGARAQGGLLVALIFFIAWPALVVRWRQARTRSGKPG